MPRPKFLTLNRVLELHGDAILAFGGNPVYDLNLLDSAIHAPQQTYHYQFGGMGATRNIMCNLASCYWFHISSNHPFVDGNKRTAYLAANVFLLTNGYRMDLPYMTGLSISLRIAKSETSKADLVRRIAPYVILN